MHRLSSSRPGPFSTHPHVLSTNPDVAAVKMISVRQAHSAPAHTRCRLSESLRDILHQQIEQLAIQIHIGRRRFVTKIMREHSAQIAKTAFNIDRSRHVHRTQGAGYRDRTLQDVNIAHVCTPYLTNVDVNVRRLPRLPGRVTEQDPRKRRFALCNTIVSRN
jgi:hypothetical protein